MPERTPHIAIIGAGIGGLTAVVCLRLKSASTSGPMSMREALPGLGAGIQQAPNAVRVPVGLGPEAKLPRPSGP